MNTTVRTKQVGEWIVRELLAGEANKADKIKRDGGDVLAYLAFACTLISATPQGSPAFSSLDEVAKLPWRVVKEIGETALELSGLADVKSE